MVFLGGSMEPTPLGHQREWKYLGHLSVKENVILCQSQEKKQSLSHTLWHLQGILARFSMQIIEQCSSTQSQFMYLTHLCKFGSKLVLSHVSTLSLGNFFDSVT